LGGENVERVSEANSRGLPWIVVYLAYRLAKGSFHLGLSTETLNVSFQRAFNHTFSNRDYDGSRTRRRYQWG